MKIHNPLLYTLGVIALTLHLVEWAIVVASGFTTHSVLLLILTFIVGTRDILYSIEHDTSQKENDDK